MTSNPSLRRTVGVAPSLLAVSAATVLTAFALPVLDLRDPWDHASGHAIVSLSAAMLTFLAKRHWPAAIHGTAGRAARLVLVTGLGVSATGQALEAAGAFGFEGGWLRSRLADLHATAAYVGTLGLVLTIFGMLASVAVAATARMGLLGTRWMAAAFAVPIAAVGLFVAGAFALGY